MVDGQFDQLVASVVGDADDVPLASNGKFWLDRRQRSIHKLPSTKKSDTRERRAELWDWVALTAGVEPSLS